MPMNASRPVIVYISAASDLMAEREALVRMIAELPVTLPWRIVQTPIKAKIPDLEALPAADLYFLIMGGDIRAPVGLEWLMAERAQRPVIAFLKQGIGHTPTGQIFISQNKTIWRPFTDAADLSRQTRQILAEHLTRHAVRYALSQTELEQLAALPKSKEKKETPGGHEAAQSAVILSRERYTPTDGVIVDDP